MGNEISTNPVSHFSEEGKQSQETNEILGDNFLDVSLNNFHLYIDPGTQPGYPIKFL